MELLKSPQVELLVNMMEQRGDKGVKRFISMLEATAEKAPEHKIILSELAKDECFTQIMSCDWRTQSSAFSHVYGSRTSVY